MIPVLKAAPDTPYLSAHHFVAANSIHGTTAVICTTGFYLDYSL
jgi:hypothetical protein